MSNAAETIVAFLTKNKAFFPATVVQEKCGLSDAEFKPAWAALKKAGTVATLPRDKKYWGLAIHVV